MDDTEPLTISVITATFNRVSIVGEALESVKTQDYAQVEHIIQDGMSNDGTLDVLAQYAGPYTLIESAPDDGIYDAINKGIARASGDVIGLMHSDDFFADQTILSQVAAAFSDPSIDGVYGDLDYVTAVDTSRIVRRWRSGTFMPAKLHKGWMPPHPTLYLRREVFDKWGVYDTSFRIAADYDAMLRYLAKGEINVVYVPEVFVKMRVGGESNKSVSKILQKSAEDLKALRKNGVGGIGTLALKNLSKLQQFVGRV